MRKLYSDILFVLKYLLHAERSLNPGLDAPVTAKIRYMFSSMAIIKTLFWIVIGILVSFLIANLH